MLSAIGFAFINFICIQLFGYFLGRAGCIFLTLVMMTCSLFLILISGFFYLFYEICCFNEGLPWIFSGLVDISFTSLLDALSIFMLILIFSISFIVHIYSLDYMYNDPNLPKFLSYLSLFTFFMAVLVTSSNFVQLYFGWEGVGLCSYLLISFWYTRYDASKSAMKAILYNKIGDCFLLIAICLTFYIVKSFDFSIIFMVLPYFSNATLILFNQDLSLLFLINLCVFIAAMGKSAQFFLHVWLVDAMEGPTPVSALIHAATMVTAGIYLLIRSSFLLELSPTLFINMLFIALLTIFFASFAGIFQNDLKKIIAYSTCSQLGYMLLGCSFSSYDLALFHLLTHGFFKALLFLSAGLIIHNLSEEQDLRKMGGLYLLLPNSYTFFLSGSLSLMGLPFLSGFYSKDFLLENIYVESTLLHYISFHLGCIAIGLTALYSLRLVFFVFLGLPNGFRTYYKTIQIGNEASKLTLCLLTLLSVFSVMLGFYLQEFFIGSGSSFFAFSCFQILGQNQLFLEMIYPWFLKMYPLISFLLAFLFFMIIYIIRISSLGTILLFLFLNIIYKSISFFSQGFFMNYHYSKLREFYNISLNLINFEKLLGEIKGPLWFSYYYEQYSGFFDSGKKFSTQLIFNLLLNIFFIILIAYGLFFM